MFERGYISSQLVTNLRVMHYFKNGKKQDIKADTGVIKLDRAKHSLFHLLVHYNDFKKEKTDIERLADELSSNLICNITTSFIYRFHCELAGEGIEYVRGVSKRNSSNH